MTKNQFIKKLESEGIFPETDEQIEWYDEYFESHPELKAKIDKSFAELNEREATKYMSFKIFARIFADKNATAMLSCKVEPRKITIFGFNNDKLEIEF